MHIDDIKNELLTFTYHEFLFGDKQSIQLQMEERPIISFGQDECIFYLFSLLVIPGEVEMESNK